jgi:6-phosphogluconolactonase
MRKFILLLMLLAAVNAAWAQSFYLFVGTYTNTGTLPGAPPLDSTGSKGIYVYRFDAATGKTTLLSHTTGVCNPSFLTVAPDRHHVYAVTDSRMVHAGTVSAFEFDSTSGKLKFINKVHSGGDNPAYVSVDATGRYAAVANYTGGSYSLFPIAANGSIGKGAVTIYNGHGVNHDRQEKPHTHSAVFSPDNKYLYIQDLGLDRIAIEPFDAAAPAGDPAINAVLFDNPWVPPAENPAELEDVAKLPTVPGSGPRHLTFHPNGKFAYLIEEMGGCVDVYRYNSSTGLLDSLQRITAHPDTAKGPFRSSDIHVSPDGKFLYASNRAEGTIAIFSVDNYSGLLTPVGYQSVLGKEPRNFTLDPTGNWLLVANQESKEIVLFKIDRHTGLLQPLDRHIGVPTPSCLQFIR